MSNLLRIYLIAFSVLSLSFTARAQVPELDTTLWVTNGRVGTVTKRGNTIYIGGTFTTVGPRTGCGIMADVVTGKRISPSGTRINGYVTVAIPDQQGGWYIGGDFDRVGSVRRNGLAHLMPDGSLDENWDPNPTSYDNTSPFVHALCLSGNLLYFSGKFDFVSDEPRLGLAAVDLASGRPTSWAPSQFEGFVYGIAVHNGLVYLAGSFQYMQEEFRNGLAALDAITGKISSWNPGSADGEVRALLLAGNQLFVTGYFTSLAGQPRNRLASFDLATGALTGWNPDPNGVVNALALSGGTLYAGGNFTSIAGANRNSLAAFDAGSMQLTPWAPRLAESSLALEIKALAVVGNAVYLGGLEPPGGQVRQFAGAVLATTGEATGWDPKVGGPVSAIAAGVNGSVFIGGQFNSVGGVYRNYLAALDATTGEATSWDPNPDGGVSVVTATPDAVYVGGGFTTIDGQARRYLAAFDPLSGRVTPWSPGTNSAVSSIVRANGKVYAGGSFTAVNGQNRNNLAAIDPVTGGLTDWNPNLSGTVNEIIAAGNTIFVRGEFLLANSPEKRYLAAFDAGTGGHVYPHLNANDRVHGFVLYGGRLFVGGDFTEIGGARRSYLTTIDAATGTFLDWHPSASMPVGSMTSSNDVIYLAGGFPTSEKFPYVGMNLVSGQLTYLDFSREDIITRLFAADNTLFLMGPFASLSLQRYTYGPFLGALKLGGVQRSTIKGTVFEDKNGNCVQDEAEKGLGNVVVEVQPGNYRSLSDAQGNYAVAVDTGTYTVRQIVPITRDTVAQQVCPASGPGRVRLAAYGEAATVHFGNQFFATYNLIRGNVHREKIEDCTRMFGEPGLENMKVVAEPSGAFAYTDAAGNYTIRVDTGTFQVRQVFPVRTDSLLQAVCPGAGYHPVRFTTLGNTATRDFADRLIARYNLIKGQVAVGGGNGRDCAADPAPKPLAGMKVMAEPGPYYGITDSTGHYVIRVDTGRYTVKQIMDSYNGIGVIEACPLTPAGHEVSFRTYNNTMAGKDFRDQVILRPHLTTNVTSTRRRRCFPSVTTLSYCNTGNAAATDVKVHLQLPEYVVLISASAPYTIDKDKQYVFSLGTLAAGGCGSIQVRDSVVCNDPNIRGRTQCTKVWITPVNGTTPAPDWDQSDITLKARCLANGVVRLGIYNTGTGNMADSAAFRILLDVRPALQSKYKLAAGDSLILRVPANGRTVRLEADQRPGHPTKRSTNVTLEACGTNADGGVSLGFVAQLPPDDAEPEVAVACLPITDSYDPNDKLVQPAGTTAEHYTPTGAALAYTVRFQNTGNDYAYQVVVVDTLAAEMDLGTLQLGAVSHPYRFTVSGKGRPVLTWTFDNINLPDSARDQAGSNGFIQFTIKPRADLPEKTRIENFGDIFFDYNPPIRTNTVFNRIYDVPAVPTAPDRLEATAVVATPVITSFTPAAGAAGTVVALTGRQFDPVAAHNRVTFNGVAAPVTAATPTTLTVTVPPGAVAGRIGVVTPDGAALSATDFSLVLPPPTAVVPNALSGRVRIYPNPAPGRFVVEFTQPTGGITELVTLDARGQRVHTLSLAGKRVARAEIDLTGHPAGMYLVLIRTEQGIVARKVTLRP